MINGIINVYKEEGFTSFDVVAVMRGISGQKKVGHTGTLDPNATGVLPVCLGNATRLCDMLTDRIKEYVAVFVLGKRTDTLDTFGTVLEERPVTVSEEKLREAIASFIGGYDQVPPMYSSKKVNGQRLYDLARKGREVERKPSFVKITDIEVLDISLPYFTVRVECGKGTYIRSLGDDIGKACGELVSMAKLTRTRVDGFYIKDAYKLSELKELKTEGRFEEIVLPTDRAFMIWPELHVKSEAVKYLMNGNSLTTDEFETDGEWTGGQKYRIYTDKGEFTAIYEYDADSNCLKAYKMFIGVNN